MLTELFAHDWPRRYKGFARPKMERAARAVYERSVLELFEAIHKEVATSEGTEPIVSEARVRAEQLLAQTAPVTERKHTYFYKTEVFQIQDEMLN